MARAGQLGAVFLVSGAVGNLVDRFYVGGAARRIGEFMCYSCDFHVIFLWFSWVSRSNFYEMGCFAMSYQEIGV